SRLYCTGDMARLDEDGNLRFFGRSDRQVKLRGFRIELGEVEAVLLGAPGVRAAACAVRTTPTGIESLVAFVVPRHGTALEPAAVLAHARERLAVAMVPSAVEVLPELPRLPSGKLDREALAPAAPPQAAADT